MKKFLLFILLIAAAAAAYLFYTRSQAAAPAEEAQASTAEQSSAPSALTVTVAAPQTDIWPEEVEASGWTAAWQEVVISSELGNQRIETLTADVGDTVKQGDLLVELSHASLENDIAELEASVESAQAELDLATADADRARQLDGAGSGALSKQEAAEYYATERKSRAELASAQAQLASSQLDLEHARINAAYGGVISSREAVMGDVVSEGEELYRLIRDNRIEWQAEVPLRQLLPIKVGTPVSIPSPLGEVTGEVRRIAPAASEENGRVKVYVSLNEPEDGPDPKTGIMISGSLVTGESDALHVPSSAIVLLDGFSYVFVLDPEDQTKVRRERVETGRRRDDRIELLGDFDANAQVVQAGGSFLSDGSTVTVTDVAEDAAEQASAPNNASGEEAGQ
ncbi:efflux RND transporter periplasmic adaptor subunit [Paracoccus aurantiacus]|uniref:Efflux RND transporter periplasmic adaptor subunit n=1 Tax=Paracoccus aurantiacus TaxID=2599412 RepID=A0A5C6RZA1_9RHOB|nr:efflux RND transporter periplasmic adaptor subunit [Paracoccus aurantiacus]TXB67424.1 efflux RND transporter periplasmic adaptor subunit [Paracoccus aurantiacus]